MEIVKDSMLIGYVTGNSIDRKFMQSVFNYMNYDAQNRRCVLGLFNKEGFFVDDNRNSLVRQFLKTPAEWLLSLDTDISFDAPAPYALFDSAKKNGAMIMAGIYFGFVADGAVRPTWWVEGDEATGKIKTIPAIKFGEVYQLAACGMGFTLIHRSVFETFLLTPWADSVWTWFGRDLALIGDQPAPTGEDVTFCLRAKTLGFSTFGHAGVEAKHAKRIELGWKEFAIFYQANYKGVRGDA